ncbi:MAG: glycosyltransferase family 2 protein [Defluviitaleaceae bacterium]|nr:glycosyltransferase family 2 protein [Defluviitaleaceae bacterium]
MRPVYSVIVPCFNEEDVINETHSRLTNVMRSMSEPYEIIYVNDGSRDRTAHMIAETCNADKNVVLINFSRNFGQMPAITAGMEHALGDAVIVIDADLQDPPEVLPQMSELWKQGYDVVYGKRVKRKGESFLKKFTAKIYYRLLHRLTQVNIPVDTGEFRLIDRKVCDAVNRLGEKNRYIRGLVSWVGFKQIAFEFYREERFAGVTKYSLKKMIALAMAGITSFSYKPLKLATSIGFFISFCSFVYMIVILCQRIFTETTVTGWASTIGLILFTQGIVLMILGLMGEYIGRIFEEIKDRPIYLVQEIIGRDGDKND